MLDFKNIKPEDPRLPKGGWAPGGYACECRDCHCTFTGDKRAYQCADCAHGFTRTTVVNISGGAGCDVYGGRGTPLGNQFMRPGGNRKTAIARFQVWFSERVATDPAFREYLLSLAGKRLGCHCKPLDCHLDIVAAWIDAHRPDARLPGDIAPADYADAIGHAPWCGCEHCKS